MKKLLLASLITLFYSVSFAQTFTDGVKNQVTFASGVIVANDSVTLVETDPNVSTGVKALTTTDVNNLEDMLLTFNDRGNPDGYYVRLAYSYARPSWLIGIGDEIIQWSGTSSQYLRGDGSYVTFPTIPTLTTQITESGVSNIWFTNTRARAAVSAGTGISYNSSTGVITNSSTYTAPTLSGSNGITITGTSPNFTVSKTKRQETYSGTTDGSGNYTVTFATAYSVAPNIQANQTNQSATNQFSKVSNISTTGFTVNVYAQTTTTILGIIVLQSTVSVVPSIPVDVLITEK